jgi:hypothetical protein
MPGTSTKPVAAGDAVEVTGHKVGDAVRHGRIVEVLGEPDHLHYRIAWEDGHESVLYPSSDLRITHVAAKRG